MRDELENMAEPVSFVASILTLTATVNTAAQGFQKLIALKYAPEKVADVYHKVSIEDYFYHQWCNDASSLESSKHSSKSLNSRRNSLQ